MLDDTLTLILAGGHGSRLQPLTLERAKPAVPFGGKYRIIDFPLVNCLHSGLRRILVLSQYKSHSLQKHLRDGWSLFNPELGEYITMVPPQMRSGESWYAGTADAVYQNLYMLQRSGARRVLILPGDHIYRMDYAALIAHHERSGAELTVVTHDPLPEEAPALGAMAVDADGRVTGLGTVADDPGWRCSMGIYLFNLDRLTELLEADHADAGSSHDIGHDLLPGLVARGGVYAYRFGGSSGRVTPDRYWRDVGTLDGYYEANMDLLRPEPALDLYQPDWPIRTYEPQYPPARTVPGASGDEGLFLNSIIAGGVVVRGGGVQHSVLFPRVTVGEEAMVHDAILFDGVEVGDGARLDRCIVDKGVKVPPGETIGHDRERDAARFTLSEQGVVVVPKGYRFE